MVMLARVTEIHVVAEPEFTFLYYHHDILLRLQTLEQVTLLDIDLSDQCQLDQERRIIVDRLSPLNFKMSRRESVLQNGNMQMELDNGGKVLGLV
jgi:hypothetical protein